MSVEEEMTRILKECPNINCAGKRLLESAKADKSKPEAGEFTSEIYSQWGYRSLRADLSWFRGNLSEACDIIDRQETELKAKNETLKSCQDALSNYEKQALKGEK